MREMTEDNLVTLFLAQSSTHTSAVKEMDGGWREWSKDRHAGRPGERREGRSQGLGRVPMSLTGVCCFPSRPRSALTVAPLVSHPPAPSGSDLWLGQAWRPWTDN